VIKMLVTKIREFITRGVTEGYISSVRKYPRWCSRLLTPKDTSLLKLTTPKKAC
jgi:hypothetical protein